MALSFSGLLQKSINFLTSHASSNKLAESGFATAAEGRLFPKVDASVDGEDCDHDCASCTIKYPSKFKIEEDDKLYGHVKGWATHLIVATGKTDWVRNVEDEKDSIMEAVERSGIKPTNGRLMLSASDMPVPEANHQLASKTIPTTVLLLPAFTYIDQVTPQLVPQLLEKLVMAGPTTTTPLKSAASTTQTANDIAPSPASIADHLSTLPAPAASTLMSRPCPHRAVILLCSQRTRDARCGQSAPLLRKEFERHLRSLGLYRDAHDQRPGGVGIIFISHVGGHKYSANVMIYRKDGIEDDQEALHAEASQCIWLARVRPEDCEGIIKHTVLKGKLVKPERQLRGGFDRSKGLVSW